MVRNCKVLFSGLDEFAKLWRAFLACSKPRIFTNCETSGGFWGYQKPHFFAHCETWGVFLALAETPIAFRNSLFSIR